MSDQHQEIWRSRAGGWDVWEWRNGVLISAVHVPVKNRILARFDRWLWQNEFRIKEPKP